MVSLEITRHIDNCNSFVMNKVTCRGPQPGHCMLVLNLIKEPYIYAPSVFVHELCLLPARSDL